VKRLEEARARVQVIAAPTNPRPEGPLNFLRLDHPADAGEMADALRLLLDRTQPRLLHIETDGLPSGTRQLLYCASAVTRDRERDAAIALTHSPSNIWQDPPNLPGVRIYVDGRYHDGENTAFVFAARLIDAIKIARPEKSQRVHLIPFDHFERTMPVAVMEKARADWYRTAKLATGMRGEYREGTLRESMEHPKEIIVVVDTAGPPGSNSLTMRLGPDGSLVSEKPNIEEGVVRRVLENDLLQRVDPAVRPAATTVLAVMAQAVLLSGIDSPYEFTVSNELIEAHRHFVPDLPPVTLTWPSGGPGLRTHVNKPLDAGPDRSL